MKWNLNIALVAAFVCCRLGSGFVLRINIAMVVAAAVQSSVASDVVVVDPDHHRHHNNTAARSGNADDAHDYPSIISRSIAAPDGPLRQTNALAQSSTSSFGDDELPADVVDQRNDLAASTLMNPAVDGASTSVNVGAMMNETWQRPTSGRPERSPRPRQVKDTKSVRNANHSNNVSDSSIVDNDHADEKDDAIRVVVGDNDGNDIEQQHQQDHMQSDQPHQQQHFYGNFRRQPPHQNQQQQQQQQSPNHPHSSNHQDEPNVEYTKETLIKQGRLKGMVRVMHAQSGLHNVDQYLGIPYAAAPVGNGRFMPPGAPPPWHGLKVFTTLSPVCPQNLPHINGTNHQLSAGRYDQLKRLLPFLKHENEDCLFLNLYVPQWVPSDQPKRLPVIVFIHGESYEWNSGNPYDGSVLASYGQVLVVTLNYRLGILGFLKPGTSDHTVSNFGLLDQIAGLQWVKDNIGAFGGNNKAVTLMGHGTGAACVNLLMVSPVAVGLFHRAILMSGSALSDWAIASHPLQATMQIVQGLSCPLRDDHEEMLNCLRKKRYQDIMQMRVSTPEYSTVFGPVVDNLVVPNQPHKVMGQYSHVFKRYDMLFGMTEIESYHNLNAVGLAHGLLQTERDNYLRFYMQNRFEIRPDIAMALTLQEYTEIYNNPERPLSVEHRDTVLEILSDARVAAPLVQTGLYHSKVNTGCYMYVFAHNSRAGEFASLQQSIVGEDLPYVFGAPLAATTPFASKYSPEERLLSESIMVYWTNFAKTGNPKAPYHDHYLNLGPKEWERYDIDWPAFNAANMYYLNIGIPPVVNQKYKQKYMQFWNEALPDELNRTLSMKPTSIHQTVANMHSTNTAFYPNQRSGTSTLPPGASDNLNAHVLYYAGRSTTEDPFRTLKFLLNRPSLNRTELRQAASAYGGSTIIDEEPQPDPNDQNVLMGDNNEVIVKADATLSILIAIVIMFLLVNVIIILAYMIKRNYYAKTMKRKLDVMTLDGTTDDELKRSKFNDGDESFILDIGRRKNNDYEQVKTGTIRRSNHSPMNGFLLARELSSSTVDAHTKVSDWMCQEIASKQGKVSKKSSTNCSLMSKGFFRRGNANKVSVGVDATPGARSASILQQEPVEFTKPYDHKDTIICQDMAIMDSSLFESVDLRDVSMQERRRSSIPSLKGTADIIKIDHRHSRSDPVQMYYRRAPPPDEDITVFIEESDINVTSRDKSVERDIMSPEEALRTIKRRNYPKVLPNYPDQTSDYVTASVKRRSLPPQYFSMQPVMRMPPAPPPRTTSTLGRKSPRRESHLITTSPIMVAEEPPVDQEPEITCNVLHVGPLLPKSTESIYSTINRTPRTPTLYKQQFSFENAISIDNLAESHQHLEPVHHPPPSGQRSTENLHPDLAPKVIIRPLHNSRHHSTDTEPKSIPLVSTRVQLPQHEAAKSVDSKIPTLLRPSPLATPPLPPPPPTDGARESSTSTSSASSTLSADTIKQVC